MSPAPEDEPDETNDDTETTVPAAADSDISPEPSDETKPSDDSNGSEARDDMPDGSDTKGSNTALYATLIAVIILAAAALLFTIRRR